MKSISLVFLIFSLNVVFVKSKNLIKDEYVSNHENSSDISVCTTNICIKDSERILKWLDPSVDYCEDFYKFSCGSFLTYKPLHERYFTQGIGRIVEDSMNNNIKTLLSKPVLKDDNLAIKFSKYFFQKCVDRYYIEKQSPFEFLAHVDKFGWGFPLIDKDWNKNKSFNKFEILKHYPDEWKQHVAKFEILKGNQTDEYDILIEDISIPRGFSALPGVDEGIFCTSLKSVFSKSSEKCGEEISNSFTTDKQYNETFGTEFGKYYDVFPENFVDGNLTRVTFSEFNDIMKNFTITNIDWKSILENITKSSINNDTKIEVNDFNSLIKNIRWLAVFDDETFLNWFYAKVFYNYRAIMQFYPIVDSWDSYIHEKRRNEQRHEQCINVIEEYFPYVMPTITKHLIRSDAKLEIQETMSRVSTLIRNLINKSNDISNEDKASLTLKLQNLTDFNYLPILLPPFQPKSELKAFLESFDKKDTLTKMMIEGEAFRDKKLNLKDEHGIIRDNIVKRYRDNLKYVSYPYFSTKRPRYSNDAHLAVTFFNSIKSYLGDDLDNFNSYNEIFKDYEKFDDENKNLDKHLPGINFTNKQMFWITLTSLRCYKKKSHPGIIDVSSFEVPYNESKAEMKRSFGCETYPGFQNYLELDEPFFEFITKQSIEDLGLELE